MLLLERKEDEVFYNGVKLKINKQESKGPGHECVYIKDCAESNGQCWVSLSRLNKGMNEIECKQRVVKTKEKYTLSEDEKNRINELQSEIDAIIENAKKRFNNIIKMEIKEVDNLSDEDKNNYIEELKRMLNIKESK